MRRILMTVLLMALLGALPASATVADLTNVLSAFRGHLEGTAPKTTAEIQSLLTTFNANQAFIDDNLTVMTQAKDLILYYEGIHSLFRQSPTWNGFMRDDFSTVALAQAQFMIKVQQAMLSYGFTSANLAAYPGLYDGFGYSTAIHFPNGMRTINPPADPNAIYSVQIKASQPEYWGYEVLWATDPAKRPTGAYLAPGSVGTVIVPPELVNQGYTIRVGAHIHDKGSGSTQKDKYERMDYVTTLYNITSTNTLIANPLGGNIYIEIPYGVEKGLVTVQFKNIVRAPFFSNTTARQTTLSEWQATERTQPGAFADFETDKCMFTIPRNWIYAFNNPVTMMNNWDLAMDAISDLQGLPRIRNKTILYGIVDTSFKGAAGSPGYPQSNDNYNPTTDKAGNNTGHHYLYGPKFADSLHLHELGHGITISKFAGEVESIVNLPYVAVHNRKFGVSLDEANGRAVGNEGCKTVSRDHAALMWILDPDFRAGLAMDHDSMKYQHRGWGKYTDIAGLFGWEALDDFWYSEAVDAENGTNYTTNPTQYSNAASDNRILRMSRAAGVDLTPLIHFWGGHPYNLTTLKAAMLAEGLLPSVAIYDRIERYRNIVPRDQAAFDAHAVAVSSAPRDNAWYTAQKTSYDLAVGTEAVTKVQQILDLHFPGGRPASSSSTNSVIYTEEFNGAGSPLDGKAPTTGEGAWIANSILTQNGVLTADAGSAMLRFDPVPNQIYTVSLDFNYSSGSGGWFGLGFSSVSSWLTGEASVSDRFSNLSVPGFAWMICNGTSITGVWEGPRTANALSFSSPTLAPGPHTLKIVLDTTGDGSSFTADFFIDDISVTGGPKTVDATTVEDVNYVGFTQYGSGLLTGSTVDHFSLVNGNSGTVVTNPPTTWQDITETFSGSAGLALNGRMSSTGGGTWSANSIVTNNGAGVGVLTANAGSALLPFNPVTNEIYTLSVKLNYVGATAWVALGFTTATAVSAPGASSNADRFSNANVPGYAWFNYFNSGVSGVYEGGRTTNTFAFTNPGFVANRTLSVVLDTTGNGSTFTADFLVDGASITGGPKTVDVVSVAGINAVGFSISGTGLAGSTVDEFSLVKSSTPTEAPTLSYTHSGGDLVFDWTGGGFKLQMQTNSLAVGFGTNWADVPGGSISGVSVPVTDHPTAFFRLISTAP